MTRRKSPTTRQPWEADFLDIGLSEEDKSALPKWDANGARTVACLSEIVGMGCKMSISYDIRTDVYICSVTIPKQEDLEYPLCLVSRAPTFETAMRVAAYKIIVKLDGDLMGLRPQTIVRGGYA